MIHELFRTRGIPSHLLGSQPNGRQHDQQQQHSMVGNDNEYHSSDTSVEDSKIQFQNNLRKFKAKCDNELEKLLEKCESRRKTSLDRKYFGADTASTSSRQILMSAGVGSAANADLSGVIRNVRRFDSANNNFNTKDDDENNGT